MTDLQRPDDSATPLGPGALGDVGSGAEPSPAAPPASAPAPDQIAHEAVYRAKIIRRRVRIAVVFAILILGFILTLRGLSLAFVDVSQFPYMDEITNLPGESIIPPLNVPRTPVDWKVQTRQFMRDNPDSAEALGLYIQAINAYEQFRDKAWNGNAPQRFSDERDTVLPHFREYDFSPVELTTTTREFVEATSHILTLTNRVGELALFDVPGYTSANAWGPDAYDTELLARMLVLQALQTAQDGDPNLAARQAAASMGLCASFASMSSALYQFNDTSRGIIAAASPLPGILHASRITTETLVFIAQRMHDLDTKRAHFSDGYLTSGRAHIDELNFICDDPRAAVDEGAAACVAVDLSDWEGKLRYALQFKTIMPRSTHSRHLDRYFRTVAREFRKPIYESPLAKPDPKENNSEWRQSVYLRYPLSVGEASPWKTAPRYHHASALMRMNQAYALLLLGRDSEAAALRDPFRDAPLTITTATIHSVGPDFTDDNATITYDPTNGTISPGDIILQR